MEILASEKLKQSKVERKLEIGVGYIKRNCIDRKWQSIRHTDIALELICIFRSRA